MGDFTENIKLAHNWVLCTFSDVSEGDNAIVDGPFGSNLKTSDYVDDPLNGVPVLTTKNLEGDYSDKTVRFISKAKFEELKRSQVKPGDILVAKIGSIGKTGIYPNNARTAIIPANLLKFTVSKEVKFNYVYFYLNFFGLQNKIKAIATATAQPAFNVTKFRLLEVPLPPLPEQHRIVAKIEELFSSLDKGIESLKTAQQQLKVYRQAVLKWAFEGKLTNKSVVEGELPDGWKQTTLGKIISISSGNGLTRNKRNDDGEFLVYGGNGVTGKHSEYLFENEQLIIGRVGVHCGNAYITKPKSWVTDNAFVVSFDEKEVSKKFLLHMIKVLHLNKYSVSTAQPVISQGKLYPIEVSIPPLEEQHAIVAEIESRLSVCDKIEESIEHSLKQSEVLRQSILKKAFEGKLVPQDPNDEPASKSLERIKTEKEKTAIKKRSKN